MSSILSIFLLGLVSSAVALGPPPVVLGVAGTFAILSRSGVSTVPPSSINCDVGVSPISATGLTGFSLTVDAGNTFAKSTQVTGKLYASTYAPPTPARLTTAISNMEAAYNDAQSRIRPTFLNLRSGALGGAVLVPGLYKFNTGLTISSDLFLVGSRNDTYIFQSSGGFNIAPGAQVILSGGITSANIVWAIADAVSTGAGSHLQGILLAKTRVAIGTGAKVTGRILAQTAVTLQSATVVIPGACAA